MNCRNHPDVVEGVRACSRCGLPFCPDCLVEIAGRPYCATCKTEQLLDVRSGTDRTVLRYASVLRRFGAILFDGIVIGLPISLAFAFILDMMFGELPDTAILDNYIRGLPAGLIMTCYEALTLQTRNGQTFGKSVAKVCVVRIDGSPITPGQAWGRTIMKNILSYACLLTFIPALFTAEKTTLHDMIAGTRVIEAD